MAKPRKGEGKRPQIAVNATDEMRSNLNELRVLYAKRLGLTAELSQAQALELGLRDLRKMFEEAGER
jgi:hypothetical protein